MVKWNYQNAQCILGQMIRMIMLDISNDYPMEVIVAQAVSAKNVLHNCYGFSPKQLAFGQNPNILCTD